MRIVHGFHAKLFLAIWTTNYLFSAGEVYHYLEWGSGSDKNGEWFEESVFELDEDNLVPNLSKCKTQKVEGFLICFS